LNLSNLYATGGSEPAGQRDFKRFSDFAGLDFKFQAWISILQAWISISRLGFRFPSLDFNFQAWISISRLGFPISRLGFQFPTIHG